MTDLSDDLIERVAQRVAKATVAETFLMLGVDIADPLEVQADFRQLREWRLAKNDARTWVVRTGIGSVVTFLLGAMGWFLMQARGVAGQ